MKLILAALAGFVLGAATAWLTDAADVQRSRRPTWQEPEDGIQPPDPWTWQRVEPTITVPWTPPPWTTYS